MPYSPALGFTPRTPDEVIRLAYDSWLKIFPNASLTYEEWVGSNVFVVNHFVATELVKMEANFERVINEIFVWFKANYGSLGTAQGATYMGITAQFGDVWSKKDKNNEDTMVAGTWYLAFDYDYINQPKPDVIDATTPINPFWEGYETLLEEKLKKCVAGASVLLNDTNGGNESYTYSEDIVLVYPNGQTNTVRYVIGENIPLTIKIKYSIIKDGVIPSNAQQAIREKFLAEFTKKNTISKDFEPEIYLDNNMFPFVADFQIESSRDGAIFLSTKDEALFHQKFTTTIDDITAEPIA